jgi:hypothetical protein
MTRRAGPLIGAGDDARSLSTANWGERFSQMGEAFGRETRLPRMGLPEPPPIGTAALPPGTYDGQVIIVTGGGTGLGKAIATEFGRLGARVAIASRKPDHLEAGLAALSDIGADVMAVACDIRDPDQIAKCFDEIEAQWQLPSVLVNNAAANFPVPAEDMSPNAWRTVIDITLNGTFFMSR